MNFLIVKLAAAGDVLLTTALACALRSARPDAHIAWLTSAYAAPLLEHNPDLDEVLLTPVPGPDASSAARLRVAAATHRRLRAWRRCHPDPAALALVAHRSRALVSLVRAAGLRALALPPSMSDAAAHRLDWQRDLLRRAGIAASAPLAPRLRLSAAELALGESLWRGVPVGRRWALAAGGARNPWSAMPNRLWPRDRWLALAARARRSGIVLRWLGAAGDAPGAVPAAENLSGRLLLRQSAAVIAAADLLIGHDSLPLVLAHALARPVLGLYGPTRAAAIHAPGQPFLQGRVGCGPCYDPRAGLRGRAYLCPRPLCIEQIALDAVWARAAAFQPAPINVPA